MINNSKLMMERLIKIEEEDISKSFNEAIAHIEQLEDADEAIIFANAHLHYLEIKKKQFEKYIGMFRHYVAEKSRNDIFEQSLKQFDEDDFNHLEKVILFKKKVKH